MATIQCFRLYGAQLVSAPIDSQGVQVDRLEQLIAEHKPRMIYLIPNFGNPSGAMLSLERRRRVLELAAQHQVLVVEDDPYGDLYFGEPPPSSLLSLSAQVPGSRDFLAYCGSLSKVLSPGLRVGWLMAPTELWLAPPCASSSATPTPARLLRSRRPTTSRPDACRPPWIRCAGFMPSGHWPWARRSGVNWAKR